MEKREGYFKGHDGLNLFHRSWLASNPKGTVVVTHGMGEHSGSYERLASGLVSHGWSLHAWDLRGHGKSGGRRGVVGDFSDFSNDLACFVTMIGTPTVILGHSMGGLVTARAVLDHGSMGAKALALSSPLLGIALAVPAIKRFAAHIMAKVVPKLTLANEIKYSDLTHDQRVIEEYDRDKLRHDRTSAVLYLSIVSSMDIVLKNASRIQMPTLIQQASQDVIVSAQASRHLYESLGSSEKKWILYEGFKHEIFNEVDREKVFQDLRSWLGRWV